MIYTVMCPDCHTALIDVGEDYLECYQCGWISEDAHRRKKQNKKLKKQVEAKYGKQEN